MLEYSEQDLKYAARLRESVHREALAIVRKTRPDAAEVVDPHPVEDYFQKSWDYPGKWYAVVAIPCGYGSRRALVDAIVRDTLAGLTPLLPSDGAPDDGGRDTLPHGAGAAPQADDPALSLLAAYPDSGAEYCILKPETRERGYAAHRAALKTAWRTRFAFDEDGVLLRGDPENAAGTPLAAEALFAPEDPAGELTYREAFLSPPHGNRYTDADFDRVNAALFPKGTDALEVYRWTTDWSEYFDDGREWWGTLCLTVYDKKPDRFVVILASATD